MGLFKNLSLGGGQRRGGKTVSLSIDPAEQKKVERALAELAPKVFKKHVGAAVGMAMTPVLRWAKKFCPVDQGGLRNSLIKKRKMYTRTKSAWCGVGVTKGMARHAHLIEFGHVMVGGRAWYDKDEDAYRRTPGRKGKVLGFVKPRPFLRPAFIKCQSEVLARYRKRLAEGIEREAKASA